MSYPPDDGVWSSLGPAMDEARQEQKQHGIVVAALGELLAGTPPRAAELLQQLRTDRLQPSAAAVAALAAMLEQISESRKPQNSRSSA